MDSKRRTWLTVYRPNATGRKRFGLKLQTEGSKTRKLELPELSSINRDYLSGILSLPQADALVLVLKEKHLKEMGLEKKPSARLHDVHRDIGNRYLKLKRNPDAKDPASMEYVVWKALRLLSGLNLHIASADDIREALAEQPVGSHRKLVSHVNGIMRMLGKPVEIKPKKVKGTEVALIEEEMLLKWVKTMKNPLDRNLALTLFYSGLRLGEALNVRTGSLFQSSTGALFVSLDKQMVNGRLTELKNGVTSRSALVFPHGEDAIRSWAEIAVTAPRGRGWDKHFTKLWLKSKLPGDVPIPTVLRHSYALYGKSLNYDDQFMADSMGHSIYIHRLYYTGKESRLKDLMDRHSGAQLRKA